MRRRRESALTRQAPHGLPSSRLVSTIPPGGAIVLLTMAAYFSGVVQAPLTALVIVSEMTRNRDLTLALMAATLFGRGASALVCRESLYRALAVQFLPTRASQRDP